jgi:hypothetical protein
LRFWEIVGRDLYHSGPSASALLAAAIEYPPPTFDDLEPEHPHGTTVGRHRAVVEIAAYDHSQPFPLIGDRLVHDVSDARRFLDELRERLGKFALSLHSQKNEAADGQGGAVAA